MAKARKAEEWPADKVERRAVADLVPYARNARTHSEAQIDQIAASIREWGWTTAVLCDEAGGIIAGHGRVLAAKKLGIADVPVMVAVGWSEAQKRAYVIADNKLTENGGWDDSLLRFEIGELQGLDFNLDLIGFDGDALAGLMIESGGFGGAASEGAEKTSLAGRFGFVPFSVLSAREGPWQARKDAWISLGIKSEEGRGAPPPEAVGSQQSERTARSCAPIARAVLSRGPRPTAMRTEWRLNSGQERTNFPTRPDEG